MQYKITSNTTNFQAKALTRPPQDRWIGFFVGGVASKFQYQIIDTTLPAASLMVFLMDLGILIALPMSDRPVTFSQRQTSEFVNHRCNVNNTLGFVVFTPSQRTRKHENSGYQFGQFVH